MSNTLNKALRVFNCSHTPTDRLDYLPVDREGVVFNVHTNGAYTDVWLTAGDAVAVATDLLMSAIESGAVSPAVAADLGGELIKAANLKSIPMLARTPKPAVAAQLRSNLSPQASLVFGHMQQAGSISAREAFADHGITSASLAKRVCDIKTEGFDVKRTKLVHPLTGKRYTRYSLMAS